MRIHSPVPLHMTVWKHIVPGRGWDTVSWGPAAASFRWEAKVWVPGALFPGYGCWRGDTGPTTPARSPGAQRCWEFAEVHARESWSLRRLLITSCYGSWLLFRNQDLNSVAADSSEAGWQSPVLGSCWLMKACMGEGLSLKVLLHHALTGTTEPV